MQITCATNFKLLLTITSEESVISQGSVFVTPFICAFSGSEIWPLGPPRSCLVRFVAFFCRPFLKLGDEWTRELLGATAANRLDFADDVILLGWMEAVWPIEDSGLETPLWDTVRLSDKMGGTLKQKYTVSHDMSTIYFKNNSVTTRFPRKTLTGIKKVRMIRKYSPDAQRQRHTITLLLHPWSAAVPSRHLEQW